MSALCVLSVFRVFLCPAHGGHCREPLALQCCLLLAVCLSRSQSLALIAFIVDVAAVEHGTGLMPRNAHGNRLRHSGPHHVANSRPPEIMENPALVLKFLASPFPRAGRALVIGINLALARRANPLP